MTRGKAVQHSAIIREPDPRQVLQDLQKLILRLIVAQLNNFKLLFILINLVVKGQKLLSELLTVLAPRSSVIISKDRYLLLREQGLVFSYRHKLLRWIWSLLWFFFFCIFFRTAFSFFLGFLFLQIQRLLLYFFLLLFFNNWFW
jgi:hypothetical protein